MPHGESARRRRCRRSSCTATPSCEARCASCHEEHHGARSLVPTDTPLCTGCHKRIEKLLPGTEQPSFGDFDHHPEFAVHGWIGNPPVYRRVRLGDKSIRSRTRSSSSATRSTSGLSERGQAVARGARAAMRRGRTRRPFPPGVLRAQLRALPRHHVRRPAPRRARAARQPGQRAAGGDGGDREAPSPRRARAARRRGRRSRRRAATTRRPCTPRAAAATAATTSRRSPRRRPPTRSTTTWSTGRASPSGGCRRSRFSHPTHRFVAMRELPRGAERVDQRGRRHPAGHRAHARQCHADPPTPGKVASPCLQVCHVYHSRTSRSTVATAGPGSSSDRS